MLRTIWVCVLLVSICMLSLPGAAMAADWVRVGSGEWYVDSESVIKNDNVLEFWLYELTYDRSAKFLRHIRVELHEQPPYRGQQLRGFNYRMNNELETEIVHPHSFLIGTATSMGWLEAVETALTYAKPGKSTEDIPLLP